MIEDSRYQGIFEAVKESQAANLPVVLISVEKVLLSDIDATKLVFWGATNSSYEAEGMVRLLADKISRGDFLQEDL